MFRPSKSHGAKKGEWVLDLRGEEYPVWADPARVAGPARKVSGSGSRGHIHTGRPISAHISSRFAWCVQCRQFWDFRVCFSLCIHTGQSHKCSSCLVALVVNPPP